METSVEQAAPGVAVVRVSGRIDLLSAGAAKEALAQAVAGGLARLVVDLDEVSSIDSSGLSALISALKTARLAGGDLRIARPNKQVRLVLELTTLDKVLMPHATVEEALASY